MNKKIRILYVVNKKLPPGDYRIVYHQLTHYCETKFGMPGRTEGLLEDDFTYMGFGEGLRFNYVLDFIHLYIYLINHRDEFDFVHFFSTNLVLIGPLIARLSEIPSLVTITGFGRVYNNTKWKYRLLRPIYQSLFGSMIQLTCRVLFQNHIDMGEMSKRFPRFSEKFDYVGSAVQAPIFKEKDFSSTQLRVFLAARLMNDKGIDDFIQIASELPSNKFVFILAGPSSSGFDDLYKKVQLAHQNGLIKYCGELSSDEMANEYKQAHVLFFPSYGEGLSRVMLEAGFWGLCPLAYDIPSNRELVIDGRGCLLSPHDLNTVKKVLLIWHNDRRSLIENANAYQEYIIENYSMERYTSRMDKIMKELWVHLN